MVQGKWKITIQIQTHEHLCGEIAMSGKGMVKKNSKTYRRRDLGDSGEKKPNETLTNGNSNQ
jgi:hypothetical protein